MKKLYNIISVFLVVIVLAGCGDSTTQYTNIPQKTLERNLDNKGILIAVTEIYGDLYDNVTIRFKNGTTEVGSVSLTYGAPEKKNLTFTSGLQRLNVYYITMTAPSWFVPGQVHIECDYTDGLGLGTYIFNGLVAAWTL